MTLEIKRSTRESSITLLPRTERPPLRLHRSNFGQSLNTAQYAMVEEEKELCRCLGLVDPRSINARSAQGGKRASLDRTSRVVDDC